MEAQVATDWIRPLHNVAKSATLHYYIIGRRDEIPKVKVGGINIYYETHGVGETLVLIMGYGGSSGQWFRQIPSLSKEYRVVAFDNRGTGRSDKPDISCTMEMMAMSPPSLASRRA